MNRQGLLFVLACALAPNLAFTASYSDILAGVAMSGADYRVARQALVADTSLDDATLARDLLSPDWRVRHEAQVVQAWRLHPEACQLAWDEQPALTRVGFPRFPEGTSMSDPSLAPVILERLIHGGETTAVRGALVDLLSRAPGDWGPAFAELAVSEPDAGLRILLVSALRYVEGPVGLDGLGRALTDPESRVRAEAARVLGWRKDGSEMASQLLTALADSDAGTRAMAARTLGWQGVSLAWEPLVTALGDPEGEVRYRSLESLSHLDLARTRQLPALSTLAADPDSRVQRLVERIKGR